jgi:hypothetical protein
MTAKKFLRDKIPFKIAVEPQEVKKYQTVLGKESVLELPFSNIGLGSYPARNYCWEDSIKNGYKKHFLFDDNINGFDYFTNGKRVMCGCHEPLLTLQKFSERYFKLAISGFNYDGFVTSGTKKPFTINSHVYSGMLINNEIPFRWRLKYNEDVDLCLQALHEGWSTVLLNVFLINKVSTTAKMKGGNQDELYKNNDEKKKMLKSQSLKMIWPQYVEVVQRYGRPHHFVNWKKHFKHPLKRIVSLGTT